jgi:ABC-type microcin C transport system permease subunit YejE
VHLTIISATIGIAIALACAWYCRRLALEKGRNVVVWTLLGLFLTILAAPVLVLLPSAHSRVVEVSRPDAER